ncbi:MAG: single-stranded-DNA-specific exonuclease RecJ [Bacteriovoracaceae bacterium]
MELQTQNTTPLHPVLSRLFQKRGLDQNQVQENLSWNLRELPDLMNMLDLQKASERLILAMQSGEKIGVYGDYDVDGTTSCALLYHFFKMLDVEVDLCQPSRFVEGYGIHHSSIDVALEKGIKVLITVDCGITNTSTADYARERGIDLIITDHHKDAAEHIPRAYAVVNPNRRDEPEDSPLRSLAGVGVAFALGLRIKHDLSEMGQEMPSLYPLLQFVAIGTICDLAKLTPMNLRLSRHGLKQIPVSTYPGILAFFAQEELKAPVMSSEKISFHVGPMINSKGRLDHPERALKLLTSYDPKEIKEHYFHLEMSNRDRRLIQAEVVEEAKKEALKNIKNEILVNILYQPHWHEGVIGIVASKMVEMFEVPAIIFTNSEHEGVIKASARTAGELNLFDCLDQCKDLFIKFGGHKAAAGLSMKKENLPEFRKRMNELLKSIPAIMRTKTVTYDVEVRLEEIDAALVRDLEKLEPFGPGNERPIFRMKNSLIQNYRIMKEAHVRWTFASKDDPKRMLQGISFNYIGKWNEPTPDDLFKTQEKNGVTAQFTVGINRFQGSETIQLMVDRLLPGTLN